MKVNKKLLNKALELTKSNIQKTGGTRISMNDRLLKHLLNNELERIEIVNLITIDRLEEKGFEIKDESFEDEEFLNEFAKMAKTVKNGVDTSLSNSNNNSSFSYNKKYEGYKIQKTEDNKYTIIEVGVE